MGGSAGPPIRRFLGALMDFVFAGYRVTSVETGLVSMSDCIVDVTGADSFGWETFFDDRASAEQASAAAPGTHVFAVGFCRDDVPALLNDLQKEEPIAAAGMPDRLRAAEPVPEGDVLGCELVGWDPGWGAWHTWRCLDLVDDVGAATGVVPGEYGLIQDVQQTRSAARWLTASMLGDPKVFLWVAALLVRP